MMCLSFLSRRHKINPIKQKLKQLRSELWFILIQFSEFICANFKHAFPLFSHNAPKSEYQLFS